MRTKKLLVAVLAVLGAGVAQSADQGDVQSILDKYVAVRPRDADLAIYQLDWTSTLKSAKKKAASEGKPIFLVVVLNSFGNVYSGHC